MRKVLGMCVVVALISWTAVWGSQHIRFFQRLSSSFNSLTFSSAESSDQGRLSKSTTEGGNSAAHSQNSERGGGRPGEHQVPPLSETVKNVLAYFAIFAFMVMLTYYAEQGVRTVTERRKRRLPAAS